MIEFKSMTGFAIENFYKCDKHEYELKYNKEFLEIYEKIGKTISLKKLEILMDEIVQFFEFKYPDVLFYSTYEERNTEEYQNILAIAKKMGIEQLKFRMHHDAREFLKCGYPHHFMVLASKNDYPYTKKYIIRINEDSSINPYDLEELEEDKIIQDIEGVETPESLYMKLYNSVEKVDYSKLTALLERRKNTILLRKKFLELTALKMLYSESSLPIYSYPRVKSFIRMFQNEYKVNLNRAPIDEIMKVDYQNRKVKQFIKKQKDKLK